MEEKLGAVAKVRLVFQVLQKPLTLREINDFDASLKVTEISMALCYLLKQRYATREKIPATSIGRKLVYLYTYSNTKLPK
jgi:hypothetical protein